jgi:S1-C subfamily serine protease
MGAFKRLAFAVTTASIALGAGGAQSSSPVQQPGSRALTTQQIAAATGEAVVTIVGFDGNGKPLGQGSGFIVRSDGVVVTNWHVMAGASKATVTLKSGESFDRVSFLDETRLPTLWS